MRTEFWNERFSSPDYAYGTEPNLFFKAQLNQLARGSLLLPADGEGRNGVYAALKGWEVTAFDISSAAKNKALKLAAEKGVELKYNIHDCLSAKYPLNHFDVIALVFAHFSPEHRQACHRKLVHFLKPGGILILEGFHTTQVKFNSVNPKAGGPKNIDMLFDKEKLKDDFKDLDIQLLEQETLYLKEGEYHDGDCSVIRLVAKKPK
ncbi:MAG: class I SAM-dependent methyltransferase [Bacteroidia bacterium]|nr:class I SAM-dependent methyltransferase [Bacteroidia bacterium]MBT8267859.1 class I SAM-dependent methyltransferase [Bacteroidia bacterium]NNK69167.1 class I SAM-dependent methyltransferase [Flavobacteriaceae bacterium]NNL79736.1 class I SAM-dependent methyltransferase [Flavobacteriaceae bacterium]